MTEVVRRILREAVERLNVEANRTVRAIGHDRYSPVARRLSSHVSRSIVVDGESKPRVLKSHGRTVAACGPNVHIGVRLRNGPPIAPPLHGRGSANGRGRQVARRSYFVDDFIKMWEKHRGRAMVPEERDVLSRGCIGVTKLWLGQSDVQDYPRTNLFFADPASHRLIQDAEKILAPGDIANATVDFWRRMTVWAEKEMRDYGTSWSFTDGFGVTREASEHLQHVKDKLAQARKEAREVWSAIDGRDIKDMLDMRREAKVDGGLRAFERVRGLVQRVNEILVAGPRDADEFMRRVKADPELSRLKGVADHLPSGPPSEWRPVIYSKLFWSGQEYLRDSNGNPVLKDGYTKTVSKESPDAARFAPDPSAGQIDMSGDFGRGKPHCVAFDYGVFDDGTGNWWHANHADFRMHPQYGDPDLRPMEVYQSTSEKFFTSDSDFDSVGVGFALINPGDLGSVT